MYRKIINYNKIKLKNYRQYQQLEKEEDILTIEQYKKINKDNTIFLITYNDSLMGIFTLKEDRFKLNNKQYDCLKITYLYILKKYRSKGLAANILKDIYEMIKKFRYNIKYILIDTPIIYSAYYLDRGYSFYRAKKSIGQNQVILFKKIR